MGLLRKHTQDRTRDRTRTRAEREYLGRTGEPIDIQIASASGSRIVDVNGRSYIDLEMGWCAGNLGWNHPTIADAVRAFSGPSYAAPHFHYERWGELARQLAEIAPGDLSRSFRVATGTEAVELAIQIAQNVTGRSRILGLEDAYHGNSLGIREHVAKKLAPPLDAKAVDRLDTQLKHRDVAAFLLEPVALNLAVEVPTAEFLRGAREVCDRYGTLLVFDEVACGFGRTGRLFAAEHHGVAPDIMTLGKAITNGHAPLAATITTPAVADAIEDLDFYSTFGWHPIGVEAALATLGVWRAEQPTILANVERRSSEIVSRLLAMRWKQDVEIRIKGLAIAIEMGADAASALADTCRDRGLLVIDEDEHLMMFPALTIGAADTREALDILEQSVSA